MGGMVSRTSIVRYNPSRTLAVRGVERQECRAGVALPPVSYIFSPLLALTELPSSMIWFRPSLSWLSKVLNNLSKMLLTHSSKSPYMETAVADAGAPSSGQRRGLLARSIEAYPPKNIGRYARCEEAVYYLDSSFASHLSRRDGRQGGQMQGTQGRHLRPPFQPELRRAGQILQLPHRPSPGQET